ncbi:SGNH/GDSL hydrolase family protein [Nocardioides anomalus]|uniref:SGNH/GDSL hydrolase family protein n=1 Tax=Nocardioides anomalus TaxID=2712223 RepID=A0A6G6WEW4_9ACTN|nr:SGNH/GDSL hydrolase family protein [Nocardioides anomalus]QIG43746.1 SGNH/GDSL hydrolase family protein [Nocardioides anomalus]
MRLALVGDSIAWGVGASAEADRLGPRLARALEARGTTTETHVYAVPGARSSSLAAQVQRAVAWPPELTVVVIGANDLTHLQPVAEAAAALGEAVRRLREVGSEVVVAPAPDLSMVPHVPAPLRPLVQVASAEMRARQSEVALALGARVADADGATSRAFHDDPGRMFAADRFHPSSAGYAVIAAALLPEVLAAAGDAGAPM